MCATNEAHDLLLVGRPSQSRLRIGLPNIDLILMCNSSHFLSKEVNSQQKHDAILFSPK
jgi:hypothetical protein